MLLLKTCISYDKEILISEMKWVSFKCPFWKANASMVKSGVDAGGCHCCQCSTPKWLTLISRVEFSVLKILWTRFSNLTESSCGRHCSERDADIGWDDTVFFLVPFLTQFAIPCNVLSLLASFSITNIQIFWAARCVLL